MRAMIRDFVLAASGMVAVVVVAAPEAARHDEATLTPFRIKAADIARLNSISRRVTLEAREVVGGTMIERWRDGARTWATTNAPRVIVGEKLGNTFAERTAKLDKLERAAAKARAKDAKNLEKFVADTQKARKKSSEAMAAFYDGILAVATNVTVEAAGGI